MAIFYRPLPVSPILGCKLVRAWSISVIFAYATREDVLSLALGTTVMLIIYNGSVISKLWYTHPSQKPQCYPSWKVLYTSKEKDRISIECLKKNQLIKLNSWTVTLRESDYGLPNAPALKERDNCLAQFCSYSSNAVPEALTVAKLQFSSVRWFATRKTLLEASHSSLHSDF